MAHKQHTKSSSSMYTIYVANTICCCYSWQEWATVFFKDEVSTAQENSTNQTVITSGKSTNQTSELIVLHPIPILIRIFNVSLILIMVRIVNTINTFAWTYSILMIFSNFSSFCSYCLHSKMKKLSSREQALKLLESSGTQVLMNRPNIRNLCTGRKRELNMDPWRYFKAFSHF